MVRKSSDPALDNGPSGGAPQRRNRPVFPVTTSPEFYETARRECRGVPAEARPYASIEQLHAGLSRSERIALGFVLIVESSGERIDIPDLRSLRLDFPQLVVLAILGACDQQSSLRLQSVGVQSILLPPLDRIDVEREIATALPNVPNFKRHPDLMRRSQARLDMLIPSDLSYVIGINYEISLLLKEFGFPPQDTRINIPLACDEAITNAIIHGNGSDPEKKVNIQIYVSNNRFRMRVRDQGAGFDVATVADPTQGENVMRKSGRGVYLMRNIMDSVEYRDGGRVLELEKRNANA